MKRAIGAMLALALSFTFASAAKAQEPPHDLDINAYIDGVDDLVIQLNGIWWDHLAFARPGTWGGNNPTYVNGYAWWPEWPDNLIRSVSSSELLGGDVEFDPVITLTWTQNRNIMYIKQYPSAANDYTLIVHIDDDDPGGAAWYTFTLHGVYFKMITPNCPMDWHVNEGNALDHSVEPSDLTYDHPILGNLGDMNEDGWEDFLTVSNFRDHASADSDSYYHLAIRSGKDGALLKPRLEIPKAWNNGATLANGIRITYADGLRADFTGDGIPEFAVGTRCVGCDGKHGSLIVYDGDTGNKIYEYISKIGNAGFYAGAGDVDGDGRPDLIIGDPGQEKLFIFPSGMPLSGVSGSCAPDGGQRCAAGRRVQIQVLGRSDVTVAFNAASSHCSDVQLELSIPGHGTYTTGFTSPGGSTAPVDFGILDAGTYNMTVTAIGRLGGCNVGNLVSWAGSLAITGDIGPKGPPISARAMIPIDPTTSPKYGDFFKGKCFDPGIPLIFPGCIKGAASPLVSFGSGITVLQEHHPKRPNDPMQPPTIIAVDNQHRWIDGTASAGAHPGGGMLLAFIPPKYSTALGTALGAGPTVSVTSDNSKVLGAEGDQTTTAGTYVATVTSIATGGGVVFDHKYDSADAIIDPTVVGTEYVTITYGQPVQGAAQVPVTNTTTLSEFVATFGNLTKDSVLRATVSKLPTADPLVFEYQLGIASVALGVLNGTVGVTVPPGIPALSVYTVTPATDLNADIPGLGTGHFAGPENKVEIPGLSLSFFGKGTANLTIAVDGAPATMVPAANIIKMLPDIGEGHLGYTVENLGDLDGDGYDDVLVGAPGKVSPITLTSGTMILSGRKLTPLRFKTPIGGTGIPSSFDGYIDSSQFGYSAAGALDLTGDGVLDMAISAPGDEGSVGMVQIFSGMNRGEIYELDGTTSLQRFGQGVVALRTPPGEPPRLVVADARGDFRGYGLGVDSNQDAIPDRCQLGLDKSSSNALIEINRLSGNVLLALKSTRILAQNKGLPSSVLGIMDTNGKPEGLRGTTAAAPNWRANQLNSLQNYVHTSVTHLEDLIRDPGPNQPALVHYHSFLTGTAADIKKIDNRLKDWEKPGISWNQRTDAAGKLSKLMHRLKIGSAAKLKP